MLVLWMLYLVAGVASKNATATGDAGVMSNVFGMFCSGTPQQGMPQHTFTLDCFAPLCNYRDSCQTILDSFTKIDSFSSSNGESQPPTVEDLHAICDSGCLTRMLDVFTQFGTCLEKETGQKMDKMPSSVSLQPHVDVLCIQNPLNGEYCSIATLGMEESHPAAFENIAMNNATAYQKQVVCGTVSELGCCLTTFLEAVEQDVLNEQNVLSTCKWKKLPPPCGKLGEAKKMIDIQIKSDILWSNWFSLSQSEQKAAQYAAAQDLKSTLGADILAATFTEDADGKVQLNFNIDSTDSADLKQQIQTALGSQPPNWSNLAAAIPTVTAVTTSNAEVEEKDVTHKLPDLNTSHRKMPGFFVLYSFLFLWRVF